VYGTGVRAEKKSPTPTTVGDTSSALSAGGGGDSMGMEAWIDDQAKANDAYHWIDARVFVCLLFLPFYFLDRSDLAASTPAGNDGELLTHRDTEA